MTPSIEMRPLGRNGPLAFPIALGCMGMSGMYGPSDDEESIATIQAAVDAGVNLLDTGDFYGSASGVSTIFGALQVWELTTPGHRIGHALQVVLPRKPSHPQPQLISKEIQWPATGGDGTACRPEENTGALPYGGLLAIPPMDKGGPDLAELGLSEPGLRLAEAMRDYGLYVVDGGGNTVLRSAGNLPPALNAQLRDKDSVLLFRHLRLVKNSVVGATARILPGTAYAVEGGIGTPTWPAGGGTPLAPNTALDAPTQEARRR